MNQAKAFCPQCENEVVFVKTANLSTCSVCGFSYELSEGRPARQLTAWGAQILGVLLRVFLLMVALGVIGLAVAFAGCALALGLIKAPSGGL